MEKYKLAFIHGSADEKRRIQEGTIERVGDALDEDVYHSQCLLEYAKENYPDIEVFKRLNWRHKPETIGYFFTLFGNIVFLNTTKNMHKYGKTGIFLFPSDITDKQKQSLEDFSKRIEDFSVSIFYDLHLQDGMLDGKELYAVENESPLKVLELYEKMKNENKKVM